MNKFINKHPYLLITLTIIVACIVFKVSFGWWLLIMLAYGLILYVTHLGTAVGWTGYLLDGFLKQPKFTHALYRFAINHNTKCVHAMLAYGLDLLRDGVYEPALDIFQRIVAMKNVQPMLLKYAEQDLGIAYWKCGQLDKAIETLEMMVAKYEYFSPDFNTTLGYFYILAGDYEKAMDFTEKALIESETHGPAYDNLGQMAYRQGNYEEAEKQFLKALDLKDTMVDSKFHLGLIYESWGDLESAAEYFLAAHQCKITGMNTVSREEVDAKYNEYWGDGATPLTSNTDEEYDSDDTDNIETEELSELKAYADEDTDDIETEDR